ncbi:MULTISPECIES: ABC transporter substrate-binding protein [unclassified Devosia]|uniref:ABC transporter substrate-binding protein n=1 Tax=unclassified Devosia TaxID=196773 RepID=UPI00086E2784|nr:MULTISPECIES: ABC transporter substrate-binding protein [unclassified Devosia]MBN9364404.1 carbohydrate ABC transporter substrate-binding protein [Devosia sp.]ODS87023.1 MAG: hypothetical protein ABS47_12755 [Devosia sp. SCN 66-27]OJX20809.1 MAG: hypothetical protein BGO83_04565 [Devosia sp. 66-14]
MSKQIGLGVLCAVLMSGTAFAQSAPKVEVLHWLTAGAESAAIKVLADGVTARGGEWVDVATPGGGSDARALLATGLAGGNPAGVSFLGMGTETAELAAQGVMRDIGGYAREKGYLDSVPDYALAMGTDGTDDAAIYALPVAFETQNFMWYSKPVYAAAGLTPPTTWDEFLAQAPKLREAGFIPLAMGAQAWQINLLFNAIVLGEGAPYYDRLFVTHDETATTAPELVDAFRILRELSKLTDDGAPNRSWNDTLNLVAEGRAALQVMGSWAGAELGNMGKVYDTDWGCALSPGSPIVMVGATGFQFPKLNTPDGEAGQDIFIDTMMDPVVQTAFSVQKGSIPARTDADISGLSACSQLAAEAVRDGKGAPYTTGVLGSEVRGLLTDYLNNFWANGSITPEDGAAEYGRILSANS